MPVVEIGTGIAVGAVTLWVLPRLMHEAAGLVILGTFLLIGVAMAVVYGHGEEAAKVAGSTACYILFVAMFKTIETRSRYKMDELFLVCLSLAALPLCGTVLGWFILAAAVEGGWNELGGASVAALVAALAGRALHSVLQRSGRRGGGWGAAALADRDVTGASSS